MQEFTRLLALLPALTFGAAAGAAPPAGDCPAVPGLDALLQPGTVLLLGEIHGTAQAPAFVATVVCHALARELPVTVGLEIPLGEQERLQAFLASDGGRAARAALLAGPLWQAEVQYGVSSRAVLELLDTLRAHRTAGARLEVLAYDPGPGPAQQRDRAMAGNLAAVLGAQPQRFAVVLSGNLHNRLTVGTPFDREMKPMGHLLRQRLDGRRVVSLDMAHQGGTAWICTGSQAADCGVQRISGAAERTSGVELYETEDGTAPFSGRYFTGPVTASPPAALGDGSAP